jgi:hypothetical protein
MGKRAGMAPAGMARPGAPAHGATVSATSYSCSIGNFARNLRPDRGNDYCLLAIMENSNARQYSDLQAHFQYVFSQQCREFLCGVNCGINCACGKAGKWLRRAAIKMDRIKLGAAIHQPASQD